MLTRCNNVNKNMRGVPDLLAGTRSSSSTPNEYLNPLALLPVGDRYRETFSEAPGRMKFLGVIVYYFTKWIEAQPLECIAGRHIIKFLWKNIITTFGTPKVLVSDNGI